jgi:hypothetical protein
MKVQIVSEDALVATATLAAPSNASSTASCLLVDARRDIETYQFAASEEAH